MDTNNKVTNKLILQQASHILDRLLQKESKKNGNDNTLCLLMWIIIYKTLTLYRYNLCYL